MGTGCVGESVTLYRLSLTTDNWPLATTFKEPFPARTLGAANEDTTTPSPHFRDTAPRRSAASVLVTGVCDQIQAPRCTKATAPRKS